MSVQPPVSESCTTCPHLDEFHGSCTHDLRQTVVRELAASPELSCPIYPAVRTDAMQQLESDLSK